MSARKGDPSNRPPTMQDVAKLAGVSQPTVSRVLNQTETPIPVRVALSKTAPPSGKGGLIPITRF